MAARDFEDTGKAALRGAPQPGALLQGRLVPVAIVAAVVLGVGVLFASAFQQSGGGDLEFSVYQGQEVLEGEQVVFAELFGQGKPVVLNFWAGLLVGLAVGLSAS